VFFRKLVTLAG